MTAMATELDFVKKELMMAKDKISWLISEQEMRWEKEWEKRDKEIANLNLDLKNLLVCRLMNANYNT